MSGRFKTLLKAALADVLTAGASTYRTALGLGSAYLSGGTDVAVADGGTGSSTASAARTALGFSATALAEIPVSGLVITNYPAERRALFTFTAVHVTITHSGGADGYGSLKIADFPSMAIYRGGGYMKLTLTASGGINASSTYKMGIGVTAQSAAAADLSGSNQRNFFNAGSSYSGTLSSSAETINATIAISTFIEGWDTARSMYLNFAGFTTTSSGTITLNGVFEYRY